MLPESRFEEQVNSILLKQNIKFEWNDSKNNQNPKRFRLSVYHPNDNYTPDFLLDWTVYTRRKVALETHSEFDKDKIIRLKRFRDIYFDDYYLIIITEARDSFNKQLNDNKLKRNNVCDEVWFEPAPTKKPNRKPNKNSKRRGFNKYTPPISVIRYNYIERRLLEFKIKHSLFITTMAPTIQANPTGIQVEKLDTTAEVGIPITPAPIKETTTETIQDLNIDKKITHKNIQIDVNYFLKADQEKADKLVVEKNFEEAIKIYNNMIKKAKTAQKQQELFDKKQEIKRVLNEQHIYKIQQEESKSTGGEPIPKEIKKERLLDKIKRIFKR
jgi:hypothetical protein